MSGGDALLAYAGFIAIVGVLGSAAAWASGNADSPLPRKRTFARWVAGVVLILLLAIAAGLVVYNWPSASYDCRSPDPVSGGVDDSNCR